MATGLDWTTKMDRNRLDFRSTGSCPGSGSVAVAVAQRLLMKSNQLWTGLSVPFDAPILQLQITPNVKEIGWELTEL
jgi:hypothetical protein